MFPISIRALYIPTANLQLTFKLENMKQKGPWFVAAFLFCRS
jgi:hypothetical protein